MTHTRAHALALDHKSMTVGVVVAVKLPQVRPTLTATLDPRTVWISLILHRVDSPGHPTCPPVVTKKS